MGEDGVKTSGEIRTIREQAKLTGLGKEQPEIEERINQEYAHQEIGDELRKPARRKASGSDGIPGLAYKAESNGQPNH